MDERTMRKEVIKKLCELAKTDKDIYLITPDMGYGILEPFQKKFPDRFINVGIAEQTAINVAVGLALSGKKPYVYGILTFTLYRAFEQIRNYMCHLQLNIGIIGVGKDMTYDKLDYSHHAMDDQSIFGSLEILVCGWPSIFFKLKAPRYMRLK